MKAKGGPSLEDNAFKAGGAATGIGTSIGGDVAKGVIVGDKVKDDKEGKATPIAINTFKSTAAEAVPSGKKVLGQVMNLVKFTKKPRVFMACTFPVHGLPGVLSLINSSFILKTPLIDGENTKYSK